MNYTADQVYGALLDAGADAQNDYSGRGMYGERCPSFECDELSDAFKVFVNLAAQDENMAFALASGARTDSMGMGMVVYWPRITYPKEVPTEAA